ncbi:hypothetical protein OO184_19865 [Photorhabdus sp. APURE]|uniref:hypothetical protein n=1 Tax=Photorhabdus aballayi TaxID=2991723 RepID=UPI00223E6E3B|nr:hypothetical protein [Photorhabdus aballayi]MCW7550126.1 hypothetical protein [Photorhabdus aballayi]
MGSCGKESNTTLKAVKNKALSNIGEFEGEVCDGVTEWEKPKISWCVWMGRNALV